MISVVSKDNEPLGDFGGSVWSWERGVDPFHADAMPDWFKQAGNKGARKEGWFGLDHWGNRIVFVPDGTLEHVRDGGAK